MKSMLLAKVKTATAILLAVTLLIGAGGQIEDGELERIVSGHILGSGQIREEPFAVRAEDYRVRQGDLFVRRRLEHDLPGPFFRGGRADARIPA